MRRHCLWNAFSHATVIGSAMFLIFFFIDQVNPAMDFLGSPLSKWCLFVYCIASMLTGLCSAIYLFQRSKSADRKHSRPRSTAGEAVRREKGQTAGYFREEENSGGHGTSGEAPRYGDPAREREYRRDTRQNHVG